MNYISIKLFLKKNRHVRLLGKLTGMLCKVRPSVLIHIFLVCSVILMTVKSGTETRK